MNALDYWELHKDRLAFDQRGDFLVIYQHRTDPSLSFFEYYKWRGEVGGASRHWDLEGYACLQSIDLNMIRKDLDPTYRIRKRRVARGA